MFKIISIEFYSSTYRLYDYPAPNGLRYPRWGWDGEAVQPEK